jgi:hypothetical protein
MPAPSSGGMEFWGIHIRPQQMGLSSSAWFVNVVQICYTFRTDAVSSRILQSFGIFQRRHQIDLVTSKKSEIGSFDYT